MMKSKRQNTSAGGLLLASGCWNRKTQWTVQASSIPVIEIKLKKQKTKHNFQLHRKYYTLTLLKPFSDMGDKTLMALPIC